MTPQLFLSATTAMWMSTFRLQRKQRYLLDHLNLALMTMIAQLDIFVRDSLFYASESPVSRALSRHPLCPTLFIKPHFNLSRETPHLREKPLKLWYLESTRTKFMPKTRLAMTSPSRLSPTSQKIHRMRNITSSLSALRKNYQPISYNNENSFLQWKQPTNQSYI